MADQKPTDNQNPEFCKPKVMHTFFEHNLNNNCCHVDVFGFPQDPKDEEKAQEECMKKQYQMKANWPPVSGHSALLQKRLAKGV